MPSNNPTPQVRLSAGDTHLGGLAQSCDARPLPGMHGRYEVSVSMIADDYDAVMAFIDALRTQRSTWTHTAAR